MGEKKERPRMVVTRQSDVPEEEKQVVLILPKRGIDRVNSRVTIEIPQYNARFVLERTDSWARILPGEEGKRTGEPGKPLGRQKLDSDKPAILHVSRSLWNRVHKGVANWAASILHASRRMAEPINSSGAFSITLEEALKLPGFEEQRLLDSAKKESKLAAAKQWWLILWQATFADFPEALIEASSESQALRKARRVPALGTFTVVSDLLSAVPLGTDKAAAQAEMSRREKEAQAAQERAFHPSPEEIKERERISGQLRDLAARHRDNQSFLF